MNWSVNEGCLFNYLLQLHKMKIEELIGKKVKDIKVEIKDYAYDGSVPIHESTCRIILETGEIFEIPYNNLSKLEMESICNENLKSIFRNYKKPTLLNKFLVFFGFYSDSQNLISKNIENVKGKVIIGIFQYKDGFSKTNRAWDKCLIEMESGFLISEKTISSEATGHAGIWIFSSKNDLLNRIGKGFEKIN